MAFMGADPKDILSDGVPIHKKRVRGSRFYIPRKWSTALSAMRAVDREYPCQDARSDEANDE